MHTTYGAVQPLYSHHLHLIKMESLLYPFKRQDRHQRNCCFHLLEERFNLHVVYGLFLVIQRWRWTQRNMPRGEAYAHVLFYVTSFSYGGGWVFFSALPSKKWVYPNSIKIFVQPAFLTSSCGKAATGGLKSQTVNG